MATERPSSQRSTLAVMLTVVSVVLVLVAVTAQSARVPVVYEFPSAPPISPGPSRSRPPPSTPPTPSPPASPAPIDFQLQILVAIAVLAIAGLLVTLVVLLIRAGAARREKAAIDVGLDEVDRGGVDLVAVRQHLARSTATLDVSGDVRTAIVRCWEGLEWIAADAGAVRDPAQTAREFTRTVLQQADFPAEPIDRLAELYEAALFSQGRLPERARDEAVRSLEQLQAAADGEDRL